MFVLATPSLKASILQPTAGWTRRILTSRFVEEKFQKFKFSKIELNFQDIQESCEPTMFSIEQLLFAIANDQRTKDETILKVLPMLSEAYEAEKINRQALKVNFKTSI